MATGSGLDAQFGFAEEATWGTTVTPDHFVEFNSESITREPTFLEPTGLRPGVKHKRVARVRQSRLDITGEVEVEFATKGMGLLVKHMLGSDLAAPVQIGVTTAYRQAHTPGGYVGKGLTMQVGRPEPDGTVQPFTYVGCKIPQWSFTVEDNEIPMLTLNVDGRDEDEAEVLASASYVTGAEIFDFSQATLTLGGTATTTGGVTSIAGGVAVTTIITEMTVEGETPMANERYGLGSGGIKAEQLENDTPTITGELSAEFSKAELYDVFRDNTTTAMELKFEGALIGASGENDTLSFIFPAVKLKEAAPNVEGPDVVQMTTTFEAYSDGTNPVVQVMIISDELVF